ncbi:MAG: hypothetical protein ACD_71C00038G0001 [uncultured bacterium (gcode 4)]|uniref:Uncharacterized protein n=1 Tax=uncultured bacterium (gcode 4) TaxID=1234023 RepID=K2A3R9_9BACT|nr:MAG: hypothetical protein ACD_71C00038G0001 [uncultured bacterium (gcode 4)]
MLERQGYNPELQAEIRKSVDGPVDLGHHNEVLSGEDKEYETKDLDIREQYWYDFLQNEWDRKLELLGGTDYSLRKELLDMNLYHTYGDNNEDLEFKKEVYDKIAHAVKISKDWEETVDETALFDLFVFVAEYRAKQEEKELRLGTIYISTIINKPGDGHIEIGNGEGIEKETFLRIEEFESILKKRGIAYHDVEMTDKSQMSQEDRKIFENMVRTSFDGHYKGYIIPSLGISFKISDLEGVGTYAINAIPDVNDVEEVSKFFSDTSKYPRKLIRWDKEKGMEEWVKKIEDFLDTNEEKRSSGLDSKERKKRIYILPESPFLAPVDALNVSDVAKMLGVSNGTIDKYIRPYFKEEHIAKSPEDLLSDSRIFVALCRGGKRKVKNTKIFLSPALIRFLRENKNIQNIVESKKVSNWSFNIKQIADITGLSFNTVKSYVDKIEVEETKDVSDLNRLDKLCFMSFSQGVKYSPAVYVELLKNPDYKKLLTEMKAPKVAYSELTLAQLYHMLPSTLYDSYISKLDIKQASTESDLSDKNQVFFGLARGVGTRGELSKYYSPAIVALLEDTFSVLRYLRENGKSNFNFFTVNKMITSVRSSEKKIREVLEVLGDDVIETVDIELLKSDNTLCKMEFGGYTYYSQAVVDKIKEMLAK